MGSHQLLIKNTYVNFGAYAPAKRHYIAKRGLESAFFLHTRPLLHPYAITLPDALASLARLCLLHYPIDADTTVTRLPKPDVRQNEILTALGVALPQK